MVDSVVQTKSTLRDEARKSDGFVIKCSADIHNHLPLKNAQEISYHCTRVKTECSPFPAHPGPENIPLACNAPQRRLETSNRPFH